MNFPQIKELDKEIDEISLFYDNKDCTYLLRNQIISKIRNSQNRGNKQISLNRKVLFQLLKSLYYSLSFFGNYDFWVFSNAERRKIINGEYVDRVASMVSEYNSKTLFIENPVIANHKKPSSDLVFSDAVFYFLSFFIGKIFVKKSKVQLNGDINKIETKYNIKLDSFGLLKRYIGQYFLMKSVLSIKRPKKVFLVYPDGYSGYIRAFKEFGIPVIELQHGVIYKNHPSYLCCLSSNIESFRPDFVFVYGMQDRKTLEEINYISNVENIVAVGSYMLWKYKKGSIIISNYLDNILNLSLQRKRVAVSATVNDLDRIVNFCKRVNSENDIFWFYVMPRISSSNELDEEGITIVDVNRTNIYELMISCEIHLTISSTTALEAVYLNKKSVVFEEIEGESFFRKNYSNIESLKYVKNAFDFILISNLEKEPKDFSIEQFYIEDLMRNFSNSVEKIN